MTNFEKFPELNVPGHVAEAGWESIANTISEKIGGKGKRSVLVIECYHGVDTAEMIKELQGKIAGVQAIDVAEAMLSVEEIRNKVQQYVTDDPVFGYMSPLEMKDFFDAGKLKALKERVDGIDEGVIIVYGIGATLVGLEPDLLIYADMPRWEIQLRFRKNLVNNLGDQNVNDQFSYQYKRAFYVDWRVCDRLKREWLHKADFVLDTTKSNDPRMVSGEALQAALKLAAARPFRVVPFFDPGPWGGQWLKEVCDLDRSQKNFAWAFDCVPEENSLIFRFGDTRIETPAINLVFYQPGALLGTPVHEAFGEEFPIRFDFLDTMEGGNLSLQVHPLKAYIREQFGMAYTQDESYYFMDAKPGAFVYLGLKENIDAEEMVRELKEAQKGEQPFDADRFVEKFPIVKHDHVLIPAGTVHCSGADSVVLEISATPYIFTFKLWDWGRMGLDGKPRPISLEHGAKNIQWNRTTKWVKQNLVNHFETIGEGEGWKEERTGLYEDSFIETRRHWFTGKVEHDTNGVVNVLNLVEGREVIVESPDHAFEPFIVHYAETFIVPAAVGKYTVRPHGEAEGTHCATMKAYVRTENLQDYRIN
ncbi:MAG: mannose-6-phosphate isomerase [Citrobacter freundii]|nr:MAG: mannose-6-phosphate isomerase [Citrobacter freundii]